MARELHDKLTLDACFDFYASRRKCWRPPQDQNGGSRALYLDLGLRNSQTFIQSGNVVFQTEERNLRQLPKRIEDAIEQSFGFRPSVILRTSGELKSVIARNPFARESDIDPARLLVTFLASDPGREARRESFTRSRVTPRGLHIDGRELYIYYPNGAGRSKLSLLLIEKMLKVPGTARNWNSIGKLVSMANALEHSL